ncbi:type II toxin-antitoxin system HipA family toxin [Brachybacterium nesterenkovii]|uniref:type II toxin-antitoxin system HipA family toxin n=1 Tax=Brachybacterium nesterenkovii TaxID=47847 RepID=UPI0032193914
MLTVPVALARSRAILKVDPADYPHLVVNEAAHLVAARRLRIPVAEHSVVHDGAGVQGLLVDRFDRVIGPGGDIERLALEDAAQVMGILPAAKYAVDSEAAVLALASATHASKIAARNLYLQLVFAWLVGNGDLHAKNLSILQAPDGRWSVAPVYDVACTAVYRDMTMALPVDGRTTRIRARHWAALADAIGLPERAALSANRLALEAADAVRLDDLPFEGSVLHGAQRELRARRAQLED